MLLRAFQCRERGNFAVSGVTASVAMSSCGLLWRRLVGAAIIGLASPVLCSAGDAPLSSSSCGPLRPVDTSEGWIDYRLRDANKALHTAVVNLDIYHTNRVADALMRGVFHRSVMNDMDFTLRHSPNHHVALQQLMQYRLAGGKAYDFPEAECYFVWAHGFAPDDDVVLQINAIYVWRRGDLTRARELYEEALSLNPDSAELHYNLGLYYFATSEYEKALQQAWIAYGSGYPLPGLRKKLEQSGHWKDQPATPSKASP